MKDFFRGLDPQTAPEKPLIMPEEEETMALIPYVAPQPPAKIATQKPVTPRADLTDILEAGRDFARVGTIFVVMGCVAGGIVTFLNYVAVYVTLVNLVRLGLFVVIVVILYAIGYFIMKIEPRHRPPTYVPRETATSPPTRKVVTNVFVENGGGDVITNVHVKN
jgi:hypothetical protein